MIIPRDSIRRLAFPALIFSAASATLGWIAANVEPGDALASIDVGIETSLHMHAVPAMTEVMIVISFLGAPSTLTVVSALVCAVLLAKRMYGRAVDVATLVLGGNLLNYGLKFLMHRGRPAFDDPLLALSSYSFPSGHAMASTVFYGFVLACVLPIPGPRRGVAIAAGMVMIALVCFSRVYLGVHYVSDVLAGILEAIAWSTLMLAALRLAHEYRSNGDLEGRAE
ncbi:MAG TPA: phosphatase PAP2 family protein [Casimicrobiaceae bacterium]|nr:phosphatase PAP2 family protein [Casimicrobiaceae bacterium]